MTRLLKAIILLAWLAILVTPAWVFISTHTPAAFNDPATAFPFFGLIAFTLVWSQIMLGTFMKPLEKLFPNVFVVHVVEGLLALGFAATHWLVLISSLLPNRFNEYLSYQFVGPGMAKFAMLGQASLLLLTLGVAAGLLRNWGPIKRFWHWLHLAHYFVFFFILVHSWNLGGDLQTSPILRSLWIFFFVTVVIGIIYRRLYIPSKVGLVKATS